MRRAAFETAVAEHGRRVFTLAVYLLNDREEAEDVTQEVLVRLWQRGSEVDAGRLGAWLARVTRNRCIDVVRSRLTARSSAFATGGVDPADTVTDGRPGPESLAHAGELGSRIHAALTELPEPSRSVVLLREILGLSYGEIQEVLDMPLNSVRVTLHRGRKKMREALREEYEHVAVG
jgi:RNA polymerase sigma factor (sigma-70 family)